MAVRTKSTVKRAVKAVTTKKQSKTQGPSQAALKCVDGIIEQLCNQVPGFTSNWRSLVGDEIENLRTSMAKAITRSAPKLVTA